MSDSSGDLGSFLSGIIIGGLVGAAVALLLAPQSGEETRVMLKEKSIELKDMASERAEQVTSDARARADELRRRGQELYDEQKERIGKAIETGKEAATRSRQTEGGMEPPPDVAVE